MAPERLKTILEAALLASPHPMTPVQLVDLFDETERPTPDDVARILFDLAADCAERGVELVETGSGFRYQVKAETFPYIAALWTERQTRYSRALLETLALVAYRQPITRGEIEQIRGVAVATSILRTLEEREWVRVVGHRDVPGKPALYGTTRAFLDYFQLRSLDELPPLSALRDLDAIEPELSFEVAAPAAASSEAGAVDEPATDAHGVQEDGTFHGDSDAAAEAAALPPSSRDDDRPPVAGQESPRRAETPVDENGPDQEDPSSQRPGLETAVVNAEDPSGSGDTTDTRTS